MSAPSTGSGDGELHLTVLGDEGPSIVFCHGLFGQGRNWTTVAKALADRHRVTLVDMPNHGRSDWTDTFSYVQMAESLASALPASDSGHVVVGHSMGGKTAMCLALLRPDLVQRLAVVDISPVAYEGPSGFDDYVRAMRSLDLDTLSGRQAADAGMQELVPNPTIRSFLLQNLRRDGDGWRWQMNLDLLGDHLDDLAGWPELDRPPYDGPVMWLAGAESDYVTDAYAPAMRRLFPQVRLVTVKKAGHWVHSEQPDTFITAIRMFADADR